LHQVVVVDQQRKEVSSSVAHQRVSSSLLFVGRPTRAEQRLDELVAALRASDWRQAFEVTWAEFWDMHALFETSRPPFGYMSERSFEVLQGVRDFWRRHQDGPLVTMDAGPNVHLLYRADQMRIAQEIEFQFHGRMRVIANYHREFGGDARGAHT
jgi:diphosphomevalonate decarboxylase